MTLIIVELRDGWSLDRFIRRRRIDLWKMQRSLQVGPFLLLLGYEEVQPKVSTVDVSTQPNIAQTLALIDKPKRRGRPPTHSRDRWTRVVLAWENRDPYRRPMTLCEFLSQEFGTYADGTPCMSENSFYENRKKVIDQLRKNTVLNQETTS